MSLSISDLNFCEICHQNSIVGGNALLLTTDLQVDFGAGFKPEYSASYSVDKHGRTWTATVQGRYSAAAGGAAAGAASVGGQVYASASVVVTVR